MRFSVTERIAFSRDRVFTIYRDELAVLLPGRGSVATIETLEVRREGAQVHSVKRWTAATHGVPASIVNTFPAGAFQWRDTSTWDEATWEVRWAHRHERWAEAMRAEGTNRFEDDDGETLVHLEGDLRLHPERVPGVPDGIGRALTPTLERLLVGQLRTTLRDTLAILAERLEGC